MEHTKEPWRTADEMGLVLHSDGHIIANCETTGLPKTERANARRIVACVNACAGVETEHLEKFNVHGAASKTINWYAAQRDEWERIAETRHKVVEAMKERQEDLCAQLSTARAELSSAKEENVKLKEELAACKVLPAERPPHVWSSPPKSMDYWEDGYTDGWNRCLEAIDAARSGD